MGKATATRQTSLNNTFRVRKRAADPTLDRDAKKLAVSDPAGKAKAVESPIQVQYTALEGVFLFS